MPYFRVLLEGSGINIPVGAGRAKGFFVTRFVRAASAAQACTLAAGAAVAEWSNGRLRSHGATPHIVVSQVERVGFLTGFFARQQGYAFHPGK
jgi:hypothetical protein